MKEFSKFVGLDVHKATIAVSVAEGNGDDVRYVGEFPNTPEAIVKLVKLLRKADTAAPMLARPRPCCAWPLVSDRFRHIYYSTN
jgi:transposase